MKAFAIFLIVLCLVVTGGIIYMLVTSNLVAVSVDCESGIPNEPEGLFIIGDTIYVVDVLKNVYSLPLDMHRAD